MEEQLFHLPPLQLESGETLRDAVVAYRTWGRLSAAQDNVAWACHALTANADVLDWWPGLFGPESVFDPADYYIVCANILGSCYGSTGPLATNPQTQTSYYQDFPLLTTRDLAAAHELLRQELGIQHIHTLIGGSMGGQQAVEWAIAQPEIFEHLVLLATNAQHSPWGIAFNEAQRLAIQADQTYAEAASARGGAAGLRAARAMALLSYRSYEAYGHTQAEDMDERLDDFRASAYQRHQGDKLVARFDAYSYVALSRTMDTHNVGRGRGGVEAALHQIQAKTLVLSLPSDILFPVSEQQLLVRDIRGAMYGEVHSRYGHDGFLLETAQIAHLLERFYAPTFAH